MVNKVSEGAPSALAGPHFDGRELDNERHAMDGGFSSELSFVKLWKADNEGRAA